MFVKPVKLITGHDKSPLLMTLKASLAAFELCTVSFKSNSDLSGALRCLKVKYLTNYELSLRGG